MSKKRNNKSMAFAKGVINFPSKLLKPVTVFLQEQLHKLELRKKEIEDDDPFKDSTRLMDNASPDADAAEQFGHARASAIKEQLDRRIIQTRKALTRIKIGKYGICEDCGKMIDTDRLMAYPEATLCAKDQAKREK
ncbi:MAG: Transcriptional regulator, TraR/DksA family [Candidatus Woesebacteria bacterium GW2011_GWB1_38_8]|uniref:Transcriptional regulator, TraR/DksA family n=1 Tax=Candidatus Woesebacteria bacterium GW2011_GWB1_38_8 TaxID=1618570 RepID=A0A0G0LDC6_9BACT|nr:MAG: Transcriptional regulator, TraR/DksA family [Candidatus Woesebacteria bacterium GW2011_GWB1_38_8]